MNEIVNRAFDEERAFYGSKEVIVRHCAFDGPADGESAFKECTNISADNCFFNLRYPFWHVHQLKISDSEMTELCRAALWYSDDVEISGAKLHGIKALRECSKVRIRNCDIVSPEFGWSVSDIKMNDSTAVSEYFMMRSEEIAFRNVNFKGKYSFQYIKNAVARSLQKLGLDYLDLYLIHMPLGDYYGAWRAIEELYKEGKTRAIGVCNFDAARLMDLCYNVEIKPMVNQIERHPHYQRHEELAIMDKLGVQPQGWAPFAEGLKGMFTEPVLNEIAAKHGKTAAQVILRWNVQQGVIIIPKSVHKNRMEENLGIWDYSLDEEDMAQISSLDKGTPSMLDCTKPSEVDRLYNYLNNPVLTSLS